MLTTGIQRGIRQKSKSLPHGVHVPVREKESQKKPMCTITSGGAGSQEEKLAGQADGERSGESWYLDRWPGKAPLTGQHSLLLG